jgi:hypothetical protein
MKTIVRPSFWAFFYVGPGLALPVVNSFFVTLQRSPCGSLRAPVQLPQQLPDMSGVVMHSKLFLDQVSHPVTGP